MRNLKLPSAALLASLALTAVGGPAAAQSTCIDPASISLFCVWTYSGDYIVKKSDVSDPSGTIQDDFRGQSCLQTFLSVQQLQIQFVPAAAPSANAVGDTYVLEEFCKDE